MTKPTDPTLALHQLVDEFINKSMGVVVGKGHSPDLITSYIQTVTGLPTWHAGNPSELRTDGVIWETDPPFQYGDVMTFGRGTGPDGTMGVFLEEEVREDHQYVRVFTQGPMPAQPVSISATHLLGVYRVAAAHVQGADQVIPDGSCTHLLRVPGDHLPARKVRGQSDRA